MPVWHASIALATLQPNGLPVPMGKSERERATLLGQVLLAGPVGDGQLRIDESRRVVHVRRALSESELALLPAGWLEIAACDMAGEGGHLDEMAGRKR